MEIKGKVVSKEGVPIENATIMIIAGPFPWQDMAAISNEEGEFALSVEGEGDYQLSIHKNDQSQKIYLRPSPNIQTVVLE
jgi:uncharacterized GH25 family protein